MARSDTFLRAGNQHRDVGVGGRRSSDYVYALLNTDNGGGSDCGLHAKAEVNGSRHLNGMPRKTCHCCRYKWAKGAYSDTQEKKWEHNDDKLRECPKCQSPRQGIDTRRTTFTVELPEPNSHCTVHIREHNAALADLARFGAALVGLQAAQDMAEGKRQSANAKLKLIGETLQDLETKLEDLPKVVLPGNITLKHALACVEVVRRLRTDTPEN